MAYTPINWAENSGVTAVKLDQMDGQIDTNENDLRTIQGGTASVDGRITANENGLASFKNIQTTTFNFSGDTTTTQTVNIGNGYFVAAKIYYKVTGLTNTTTRTTVSISVDTPLGEAEISGTRVSEAVNDFDDLVIENTQYIANHAQTINNIYINYDGDYRSSATVQIAYIQI
jgi:hypothetical protein